MYVQIDPALLEELKPAGCEMESDVGTELIEHVSREIDTVMQMMTEIGENNKLTASDLRLILSLRGFNFCG